MNDSARRRYRRASVCALVFTRGASIDMTIFDSEVAEAERRAFCPKEHRAIADDFHHIHLWAKGARYNSEAVIRALKRLRQGP